MSRSYIRYGLWMSTIQIVEVSPRDGLQNESRLVSTEHKAALVRRALDAGISRVEVTAFAHPERVPQMADAEAVMAEVRDDPRLRSIGLVLNRRGLDRAIAAGCHEATVVVVVSDGLALRNQGTDTAAQVAAWRAMADDARAAGLATTVILAAAFGCPFDGEVTTSRVLEVARGVLDGGPDELAIADTIGVGVPAQVRSIVSGLRTLDAAIPLRAHFHNTRNTGYANALAAYEAGVHVLDASLGGIGGCPFAPRATGNIATEDLVYALERSGVDTGCDLDALIGASEWLGERLGRPTPSLVSKAGGFPSGISS